jgi:hypothetical protein
MLLGMIGRALWIAPAFVLCCGAAAHAIPAPIPEEQLEADAQAIVEGRVIRATFIKVTKTPRYATTHYRGVLKILRVRKGDLKAGSTIPLRWSTEGWIGKGRQPVGRGKEPAFYICEVVRVYLWRSKKKKGKKVTWHVSGRRLVKSPSRYTGPSLNRKTIRCIKGKPK